MQQSDTFRLFPFLHLNAQYSQYTVCVYTVPTYQLLHTDISKFNIPSSPHDTCGLTLSRVSDSQAPEIHTGGQTQCLNREDENMAGERETKVTEGKRVVAAAGEMAWYGGRWGRWDGEGGGGLLHRLVVQLTSPCQTVTAPYATDPLSPSKPPFPALPPSVLDRMINGVSGHASTTVPDYNKHYHNFFFFSFL